MKHKIIESFCIWCDLLGYGQPFIESGWNLYDETTYKNYKRIKDLEVAFRSVSFLHLEKALLLNDGIIRNLDLIYSGKHSMEYLHWFEDIMKNFDYLNRIDKENGNPGARAVLTYGHRFDYMDSKTTEAYYIQSSPERLKEYDKEVVIYSPKEFQMNTAFSKAYIIESAGSRIGLTGAKFYIDRSFLNALKSYLEGNFHLKQYHTPIYYENRVEIKIDWIPTKYLVNEYIDDKYMYPSNTTHIVNNITI